MNLLRFAVFSLLPIPLAAACAASVQGDGSGGEGGSGGDEPWMSTSGTGGKKDAGPLPPDAMIPCNDAQDCAGFVDACNVGSCVNGLCAKTPANEYGACDDGFYCTEDDTCIEGTCVGGTPKLCASQDSCHLGICDEELQTCKNIAGNDGAQCYDGDLCTGAGVCTGGVCNKGQPISCQVFNTACSVGVCDPAVGCTAQETNEGSACDNGDFTGCSSGKCQAGSCVSVSQNDGSPCDDGKFDPCSVGECQAGSCVSLPVNDGQPCDDGLFCTINDKCIAAACSGDPNPCAPPDNPCA